MLRSHWLSLLTGIVAVAGMILLQPPSSSEVAIQKVESAGATIVWTSDERNCGAQRAGLGGCVSERYPGVMFVSPGMTDRSTEYIVLHEHGHLLGMDECAADEYALENGALKEMAYYLPNC